MQREELLKKWENNLQQLNYDGLKELEFLFGDFVRLEEYRQDTPPERLEELRLRRAEVEAESKVREEQKRKVPLYERNNTMKLLKHQDFPIAPRYNGIKDVLEAHAVEEIGDVARWNLCMDMYILGTIDGKRQDRQRRKEAKRTEEARL